MHLPTLLSLLSLVLHCSASLLAIDYGAEWSKGSLMKPGLPLDVILARDSKRKMQSVVGWKGAERFFGSEAYAIAARYPRDSFQSLKYLLGVPFDDERVYNHSGISEARAVKSARGTFALQRSDGSVWAVEELVAMQFAHIKELAESLGGETVKDAIVTVPAYFSQFQRQAVLDSLEVAGLKPLALLNDGTAVAINYAMTRSFPEPETHIIFDAGASSIRATIATFYSTAVAPKSTSSSSKSITAKGKEATHIEIKGVGYDLVAGGTALDRRLLEVLQDDFEAKSGVMMKSDRARAKLAREAARVKAILSANADSAVNVESLYDDIDYRSRVSREAFEAACEDLKPRFAQPIVDALKAANLPLSNISSVILTGGASRTPMIQAEVIQLVGKDKIAQNVNADEAAVLGAAFYGASLSPLFRTKDIKVQEIVPYPVQISYPNPGGTKTLNTLLFAQNSKAGVKKSVQIKRKEDFKVRFSYKEPNVPLNMPANIIDVLISGVSEAARNLTDGGAKEITAKLSVQFSDSGIASVRDAILVGEGHDQTLAGAFKGFFGGGKAAEEVEQEADKVPPSDAEGLESNDTASKSEVKEDVKKELPLTFLANFLSIMPLTHSEKSDSRSRLVSLDAAELAKRRREEARNQLESYLYRLRDILDGDSQSVFMVHSTEEERAALQKLLSETSAWMHEEAETAETSVLWQKREALEHLERPIKARAKEAEDWPQALSDIQRALTAARIFLGSAQANRTEEDPDTPPKYTDEELTEVKELVEQQENWLREGMAGEEGRSKNVDAAIKTWEMNTRGKLVQDKVTRLYRRKAPKKPKTTSRTEEATATTSAGTETPAATMTVAEEEAEATTEAARESAVPPHREEL